MAPGGGVAILEDGLASLCQRDDRKRAEPDADAPATDAELLMRSH